MSKKKLQLTIQEDLIKEAKYIALKNERSISQLLEDYIKAIKQNPQLIDLIIQYGTIGSNGSNKVNTKANKPNTKAHKPHNKK